MLRPRRGRGVALAFALKGCHRRRVLDLAFGHRHYRDYNALGNQTLSLHYSEWAYTVGCFNVYQWILMVEGGREP